MLNIALEIDLVRSIFELIQMNRAYTVMPLISKRATESRGLHWQKVVYPEIKVTICVVRPVRRPQTALPLDAATRSKALLSELVNGPHAEGRDLATLLGLAVTLGRLREPCAIVSDEIEVDGNRQGRPRRGSVPRAALM